MKLQENFQNSKLISSLNTNIQNQQYVFYDEHLQDLSNLLDGSNENFTYIPVGRGDDLFEKINFYTVGKKNIDISLLAHGTSEGVSIGRSFVDEEYLSCKSVWLKGLNINNFPPNL